MHAPLIYIRIRTYKLPRADFRRFEKGLFMNIHHKILHAQHFHNSDPVSLRHLSRFPIYDTKVLVRYKIPQGFVKISASVHNISPGTNFRPSDPMPLRNRSRSQTYDAKLGLLRYIYQYLLC